MGKSETGTFARFCKTHEPRLLDPFKTVFNFQCLYKELYTELKTKLAKYANLIKVRIAFLIAEYVPSQEDASTDFVSFSKSP